MDPLSKTVTQEAQVNLAHQAMMLEDARELLRSNRAANQQHSNAMATGAGTEADMGGIHIGDQIVNHPAKQGVSRAAAVGLLAAALAAGGAGSYGLTQYFQRPTTPAPTPQLGPQEFDIDWEFDGKALKFGEPKLVK